MTRFLSGKFTNNLMRLTTEFFFFPTKKKNPAQSFPENYSLDPKITKAKCSKYTVI